MSDVTDELNRLDSAFAGNLLLATFSPADRGARRAFGRNRPAGSRRGDPASRRGCRMDATSRSGRPWSRWSSNCATGDRCRSPRSAAKGRSAGSSAAATRPPSRDAKVMVAGPALARIAHRAGGGEEPLQLRRQHLLPVRGLSARRSHAVRGLQHFPFDPAARGALAADRAGPRGRPDRADAGSAGRPARACSGRPSTPSSARLQDLGLISARRGRVIVVDRAGLKRHACECYEIVEQHFGAVIGPSGSGGSKDC